MIGSIILRLVIEVICGLDYMTGFVELYCYFSGKNYGV